MSTVSDRRNPISCLFAQNLEDRPQFFPNAWFPASQFLCCYCVWIEYRNPKLRSTHTKNAIPRQARLRNRFPDSYHIIQTLEISVLKTGSQRNQILQNTEFLQFSVSCEKNIWRILQNPWHLHKMMKKTLKFPQIMCYLLSKFIKYCNFCSWGFQIALNYDFFSAKFCDIPLILWLGKPQFYKFHVFMPILWIPPCCRQHRNFQPLHIQCKD